MRAEPVGEGHRPRSHGPYRWSMRVLIAGGGPVGLALAVALRHHGAEVILFEALPAPPPFSRAPGVLPRTLEVLQAWGLAARFLAEGTFRSDVALWRVGDDEPRLRVDLASIADATAFPGLLVLPQDRTESLLEAEARDRGAEVRRGVRFAAFDAGETGVRARLEGGEAVEGDWLVGCDGAHSTVRRQLGWPLVGKTYPARLVLADVRLDPDDPGLPWPRYVGGPHALAALRLRPDLWRVITALAPDEVPPESAADLAPRVGALFPGRAFTLAWVSAFRIHCRTSPHFRAGRVLLAGDAAHLDSPAGAMGMNAGIQDAHNLGWKLARGGEALVDSYEAERRGAVTGGVHRTTDLLARGGLLAPLWVRGVSFALAQAALAMPATRRRLLLRVTMLDTRYHSGVIVGGALAGARAPDGDLVDPLGRRLRVHDLCARAPVLLGFGVDPPEVPRVTTHRIEPEDGPHGGLRGSAAWEGWGARRGRVALVRPDGHVGWSAVDPTPEAAREAVRRALGEPSDAAQPVVAPLGREGSGTLGG